MSIYALCSTTVSMVRALLIVLGLGCCVTAKAKAGEELNTRGSACHSTELRCRLWELFRQQMERHDIPARSLPGYGPACGTTPRGSSFCCPDPILRLVIRFWGPHDPFTDPKIDHYAVCL